MRYDVMYLAATSPLSSMNGYSQVLIPADFANRLKGKLPSGMKVITDPTQIKQDLPAKENTHMHDD